MTTDPRRAEAEKVAAEVVRSWTGDVNGTLGAYISKSDEAILVERFADALLAAEDRGAKTERAAWTECTRDLGPLIAKAKADGVLDTLIEANIWPQPATCVSDADIRHATGVAIAIRPGIEAERHAKYPPPSPQEGE